MARRKCCRERLPESCANCKDGVVRRRIRWGKDRARFRPCQYCYQGFTYDASAWMAPLVYERPWLAWLKDRGFTNIKRCSGGFRGEWLLADPPKVTG